MKIIEPNFYLLNPYSGEKLTPEDGIKLLWHIESMARISHRSESKQTPESWRRFIEAVVISHGDWSVTEHASVTAVIRTDRGVTHELVRHRLFSFTQESTRFVRYGEIEFIRPVELNQTTEVAWLRSVQQAEENYFDMLEWGAKPQTARAVLPNSMAATIAVTGNLRNWRNFFLMRTSKETHPDFRRISISMLEEFKRIIPILYDDIVPEQRQIDNLRKGK